MPIGIYKRTAKHKMAIRKGLLNSEVFKTAYVHTGRYKGTFTNEIKYKVKSRDNFKCKACGSCKFLLIHHVDNDGVNSILHNLITLCRSCHRKAHGKQHEYYKNWLKQLVSTIVI